MSDDESKNPTASFFLKNGLQCLAATTIFAVILHVSRIPELSCFVWWLFGHGFALVWVWAKMRSKELGDNERDDEDE